MKFTEDVIAEAAKRCGLPEEDMWTIYYVTLEHIKKELKYGDKTAMRLSGLGTLYLQSSWMSSKIKIDNIMEKYHAARIFRQQKRKLLKEKSGRERDVLKEFQRPLLERMRRQLTYVRGGFKAHKSEVLPFIENVQNNNLKVEKVEGRRRKKQRRKEQQIKNKQQNNQQ